MAIERIGRAVLELAMDLAGFSSSLDKGEQRFRTFGSTLGGVSSDISSNFKQVSKLTRDLFGDAVIKNANNYATAVRAVGGASKLTEAEQRRVNASVTEALAKYRVLGQEAPKALTDLAHATQQADHETGGFFAHLVAGVATGELFAHALEKIGEIGFEAFKHAAEALPELIAHTTEVGNKLFEMSLKTGASVETLSKLRYVAGQTGIDFDSFGTTLFKMEKFLGSSGQAAEEANATLKRLGLSLQQLKNEKPEDAFINIIAALEKIPNRADQAAIGAAIFSRGFKEMAGLAAENIHELLDEAEKLGLVMSTETAAAAHAAEVGFKALGMQVESVGMRIGAAFLPAIIGLEHNISEVLIESLHQANDGLNAMGGSGGFLSTVATAMGTGNTAIAAQVTLYETLRDALIAVVRGGGEPLITALGFLMTEFNAAEVVLGDTLQLISLVALGFKGAALSVAEFLSVGNNFGPFRDDVARIKGEMAGLQDAITARGKSLQASKAAEKDWSDWAVKANVAVDQAVTKLGQTHTDVAAIIAHFAKVSREAVGEASDEIVGVDATANVLKAFGKSLAELTAKIDLAVAHQMSLTEQIKLFGSEASKMAAEAGGFGVAVKASLQDVADGFDVLKNNKVIDEMAADWAKVQAAFTSGTTKVFDHWMASEEKAAAASGASLLKLVSEREQYQSRLDQIGLRGTALELYRINQEEIAERRSWGERTDQNASAYDALSVLSKRYYDEQRRQATSFLFALSQTVKQTLNNLGQALSGLDFGRLFFGWGSGVTKELKQQADDARRTYARIAADGTSTPDQIHDAFEKMRKAEDDAQLTFAERMGEVWASIKNSAIRAFNEIADAFIQGALKRMIAALAGSSLAGAGSSSWAGIARSALGGLGQAGTASAAGSLLGGAGTTTIAAGGGLLGTGEATILSSAGGATLGTGGIAATSQGGTTAAAGGLSAGAVAGIAGAAGAGVAGGMLGKYLTGGAGLAAGGIGAGVGIGGSALLATSLGLAGPTLGTSLLVGGTIGLLTGLLGKSKGKKEDEQANKDLDAARASLLSEFKSTENIAALDKAIGTNLASGWGSAGKKGAIAFAEEARRFETALKTAQSAGVTLKDLLAIGQPEQTLEQRLAKVKTEIDEIGKSGGVASKDLIRLRDSLADTDEIKAFKTQQATSSATGIGQFLSSAKVSDQTGASAVGETLQGSYAALRAQGASAREAFATLKPMVEAFNKQLQETGLTGGESFGTLASLAGIAGNAISGPALDAISGLTTALVGAQNAGFLTQSMFTGLTGEIMKQRQAILDTGATDTDVNDLMQGDLQKIWQLRKDYNFEVSDTVAALLDEEEAAGKVGDKYRSSMDRAAIAMERVADALETVLGKTKKVGDAIDKIPSKKTVDVDVNYNEGSAPSSLRNPEKPVVLIDENGNVVYQGTPGPGDTRNRYARGGVIKPAYLADGGTWRDFARSEAFGWGAKGTDTVPIWATPDEGMVNVNPGMSRLTPQGLDDLNAGRPLSSGLLTKLFDSSSLRTAAAIGSLAVGSQLFTAKPFQIDRISSPSVVRHSPMRSNTSAPATPGPQHTVINLSVTVGGEIITKSEHAYKIGQGLAHGLRTNAEVRDLLRTPLISILESGL